MVRNVKAQKNLNLGVEKKLKSYDRFFSFCFLYFVFFTYNALQRSFPTSITVPARSMCAKFVQNK